MSEDKQEYSIFNEDGTFNILTSRPEGMPYEDYKLFMRAQKKAIKLYLKGKVVHLSKLYPTTRVMNLLIQDEYKELVPLPTKGRAYVKPKEDDKGSIKE